MADDSEAPEVFDKGSSKRWLVNTYDSMMVVQGSHIVCATLCVSAGVFSPVGMATMVPLMMAYFVTYLLAPIIDALEVRPYNVGSNFYCTDLYLHPV
eukprot:SAG31_NODE_18223_length_643_cov_0.838235_1_plen_97_part_00